MSIGPQEHDFTEVPAVGSGAPPTVTIEVARRSVHWGSGGGASWNRTSDLSIISDVSGFSLYFGGSLGVPVRSRSRSDRPADLRRIGTEQDAPGPHCWDRVGTGAQARLKRQRLRAVHPPSRPGPDSDLVGQHGSNLPTFGQLGCGRLQELTGSTDETPTERAGVDPRGLAGRLARGELVANPGPHDPKGG